MSAARACVDKTGHACNLCAPAAAINVKFVTPSGEEIVVKAQDGDSILDVALEHDIDIEGSYRGRGRGGGRLALCSAVVTVCGLVLCSLQVHAAASVHAPRATLSSSRTSSTRSKSRMRKKRICWTSPWA